MFAVHHWQLFIIVQTSSLKSNRVFVYPQRYVTRTNNNYVAIREMAILEEKRIFSANVKSNVRSKLN
jgi:hypothetical protein